MAPSLEPTTTEEPTSTLAPSFATDAPTFQTFPPTPYPTVEPYTWAPRPPGVTAAPTSVPSAAPTVYKHPYRVKLTRATLDASEAVALKRDRRSQMTFEWEFEPVEGAVLYEIQFRHALPVSLQAMTDAYYAALTKNRTNDIAADAKPGGRRRAVDRLGADFFPASSNDTLVQLTWTTDSASDADFVHVIYRPAGGGGADLRCLTQDEAFSSKTPLSNLADRDQRCDDAGGPIPQDCLARSDCTRFSSGRSSVFSPLALQRPLRALGSEATWATLDRMCSIATSATALFQIFVVPCRATSDGDQCDFSMPSRSILLESSCRSGRVLSQTLELRDDTVQLSPTSCLLGSALHSWEQFCEHPTVGRNGTWSEWQCARESAEDDDCLRTEQSRGTIVGLSPCNHFDRYIVRAVACMDSNCDAKKITDSVTEFVFEHPSGQRAVECLGRPSPIVRRATIAVGAVVGGSVVASVGSSIGGAVAKPAALSASSSSTTASALPVLGTVQFVALTSVRTLPILCNVLLVFCALQ